MVAGKNNLSVHDLVVRADAFIKGSIRPRRL